MEKKISVKEHEQKYHDSTRKCFMKIVFGIGVQMAERSTTIIKHYIS